MALEYIRELIESARAKGLRSSIPPESGATITGMPVVGGGKARAVMRQVGSAHDDIDGNEIVTLIAPGPRDIVIKKRKPSGFFGTNLASYLTLLGCDSVIVVGTTTSGLCSRHRGRRVQLQLSGDPGGRGLFRSERGQPRCQPV